jgi:hypothetical protein
MKVSSINGSCGSRHLGFGAALFYWAKKETQYNFLPYLGLKQLPLIV